MTTHISTSGHTVTVFVNVTCMGMYWSSLYMHNMNVSLTAVIEKFTENVRFCMICNYLSKIIPALQSRCTRFRFGPLEPKQMEHRLQHVIKQEK